MAFPSKLKDEILFGSIILLICILCSFKSYKAAEKSALCSEPKGEVEPKSEDEIKDEVEKIYNLRSKAFVTHDASELPKLFDTSQRYGKWALEHELKRIRYLDKWSSERDIEFRNVESTVRIKNSKMEGNKLKLYLEESYKFEYMYTDDEEPVLNAFGVGIRHWVTLINKEDNWVVYNDWYTDCFEDALSSTASAVSNGEIDSYTFIQYINEFTLKMKPYYDRQKAVEYADKYCGAAWGNGNNYKYNNSKYADYTGIGGDCTNFISQVIGDKEGGGLPFDGAWYHTYPKHGRGSGTKAWLNAGAFKNYLIYSGKGSLIRRGTFQEIVKSSEGNMSGALGSLQLGDLICYEKNGDIDHFAVVTGRDSHGYPLVNSHTTDRYHVPWDLGWGDKGIKFLLIHING